MSEKQELKRKASKDLEVLIFSSNIQSEEAGKAIDTGKINTPVRLFLN
jgi:hypothetical protein